MMRQKMGLMAVVEMSTSLRGAPSPSQLRDKAMLSQLMEMAAMSQIMVMSAKGTSLQGTA